MLLFLKLKNNMLARMVMVHAQICLICHLRGCDVLISCMAVRLKMGQTWIGILECCQLNFSNGLKKYLFSNYLI